jgi:hypothetical protein
MVGLAIEPGEKAFVHCAENTTVFLEEQKYGEFCEEGTEVESI